ncbi:MAG TPA: rhodanese-like domain-containing protein [Kiloniellales bacterium]
MLKKGFKQLLAEANASIDSMPVALARDMLEDDDVVFVDVREAEERAQGFIPGSVHAPRGYLEFIADPEGPMHNPVIRSGLTLVLYCGSGGRSALAAKTLQDMGFPKVCSLVGGLAAWKEAGGPVDT